MKLSKLYRRAAKQLSGRSLQVGHGMCFEICTALGGSPESTRALEALAYLEDLFHPLPRSAGGTRGYVLPDGRFVSPWWGRYWSDGEYPYNKARDLREIRNCRILALLFTADIAESEGL